MLARSGPDACSFFLRIPTLPVRSYHCGMTHDPWEIPRFSAAAVALLGRLHEHGWSMRIVPLFRRSSLDWKTFAEAVNELSDRRWVRITWRRKPRAILPPGMPEPGRDLDRIIATRHGRWRYLATWPDVW